MATDLTLGNSEPALGLAAIPAIAGPTDDGLVCSLVIPVYNEARNLETLVDEIAAALAAETGRYELVFVDDCSTDASFELLTGWLGEKPGLRVLRLGRHAGQSAALAAGIQAAHAPVIVTLDADLQNDPQDIPRLLAALADCDIVSGIRAQRQDSTLRKLSSWVANGVRRWVIGDSVQDVGCSLKAYRREWLGQIPFFNGIHRFLPGLLEARGARVRQVAVRHRPRLHGESKYGVHNRLWRGLLDLVGVSWLKLRWVDLRGCEEIRVQPSSSERHHG